MYRENKTIIVCCVQNIKHYIDEIIKKYIVRTEKRDISWKL